MKRAKFLRYPAFWQGMRVARTGGYLWTRLSRTFIPSTIA